MKGLYCDGSSIRLRDDLPTPIPGPGEVLLRVRIAGICDTDIQLAKGYLGFQGVLGHEFVGQTNTGRRVTAEINNACHVCPVCLDGRPGHCPHRTVLGIVGHDGAMAEQVVVPQVNLHEIPDEIDDREAVFIEPLAAAFRITEQLDLHPGLKMAILGDGKLGMLCAWVARTTGAQVSVIGKHASKLALAGEAITTHRLEEASTLAKRFDVVVDCTGSHSGFPTALGLVRPCGTVVLKTTVAGTYTVNLAGIVIDEVRVIGSRCGPFPKAIAALVNRQVNVRPLIGGEFTLDQAESAFRAASEKGARKILIQVAPESA
ncbi:MDR/zinc-dependent alcohol dehydrogenase-like family protein [Singulisphaera acidiphila]|uniref:Theronine dehydrogenase-like Zn-dependent dehydrogenase n=1 Tax=Singulisphaera acidiphila (strain ATCC BAA-1392 / DSM 18658 / VKM B-2454 / MOB10) TaxID=886293 RepID=L0DEP4_SINAD|nr:alcohol dehydrogenase catalytic domain-containing protein [Singulisphaera acidiphila]AGA27288.1 theronine dehydrogenase-like Zn-dependent dehydrogenase [Singulisphaera acidiphila DSM 18658]